MSRNQDISDNHLKKAADCIQRTAKSPCTPGEHRGKRRNQSADRQQSAAAAAVVVIVVSAAAAAAVVAEHEEQKDQNDNPPEAVAIVTTHNQTLLFKYQCVNPRSLRILCVLRFSEAV